MGKYAADLAAQAGQEIVGGILGLGLGSINDKRQLKQQGKLNRLQIDGNKEMASYQKALDLQMWKDTNYSAQMAELEKAGLSAGLIYGMGGAGGTTTGGGGGASVTGGHAPSGGGEALAMGMSAAQMGLLKAQRENIEAQTANLKASEKDLTASAEGKGLANAFTAWMQGTTPEGEDVGQDMTKSTRGQKEVTDIRKTEAATKESQAGTQFKLDENERQKLMNNKVMEEIGAKISLMAKQGQTQEQIYKNLVKEGDLLDAEIEWNKLDISGHPGKFITNLIKMFLKPR